jgi:hypothetical protein
LNNDTPGIIFFRNIVDKSYRNKGNYDEISF